MANIPETDEAWEKHYNMCLGIYKKHQRETKDCNNCKHFYTCDNSGFYEECLAEDNKYFEL